jgi:hypothetical protein
VTWIITGLLAVAVVVAIGIGLHFELKKIRDIVAKVREQRAKELR